MELLSFETISFFIAFVNLTIVRKLSLIFRFCESFEMQLLTQHSINVFNTMRQQKICPQSLRVAIARGNVYDFSLQAAVVVSISNFPSIHRGVIRY